MFRALLVLAAMASAGSAYAQLPAAHAGTACSLIGDPQARLACFDAAFPRPVDTSADTELASQVAQQARTCWDLTSTDIASGKSVTLTVVLSDTGQVIGTPELVGEPSGVLASSIGRAAQRAVIRCSPYRNITVATTLNITLRTEWLAQRRK